MRPYLCFTFTILLLVSVAFMFFIGLSGGRSDPLAGYALAAVLFFTVALCTTLHIEAKGIK